MAQMQVLVHVRLTADCTSLSRLAVWESLCVRVCAEVRTCVYGYGITCVQESVRGMHRQTRPREGRTRGVCAGMCCAWWTEGVLNTAPCGDGGFPPRNSQQARKNRSRQKSRLT